MTIREIYFQAEALRLLDLPVLIEKDNLNLTTNFWETLLCEVNGIKKGVTLNPPSVSGDTLEYVTFRTK